jgi:hypothetical protein
MSVDDKTFLNNQRQFLQNLIEFKEHPKILSKDDKLGFQDWFGIPLAIVTRADLSSVLERFLNKNLTEADVYDWAEALSGRDTIDFEEGYSSLIVDTLMCLVANHLGGSPITPQDAKGFLEAIQHAKYQIEE